MSYFDLSAATEATVHELHGLTQFEIERIIWRGRGVSELVGLRDVFTDDDIAVGIAQHPEFTHFDRHFQNWAFSAVDAMIDDELEGVG